MQAYKFDTRISENGVISLPHESELFDMEVEIFIVPKVTVRKNNNSKKAMSDFLEKWAGTFPSMTDEEVDNAKYEYLMEKYK